VHANLLEMRFGRWDGQPWSTIAQAEVDAWCADFRDHRPGGVESLSDVFGRVAAWWEGAQQAGQAQARHYPLLIVGHGGWMLAARWLHEHPDDHQEVRADQWPAPPAYGQCWRLSPPIWPPALPPIDQ
jgi:alpha-ribazole phosphatase